MRNHDTRNNIMKVAAGIAIVAAGFIFRSYGAELARYVRIKRM